MTDPEAPTTSDVMAAVHRANTTVYQAMSAVMDDVGPVDKGSTNEQQGYRFRGIDAFMNALSPAMRKHGVVMVPNVLDHNRSERARNNTGGVTITSVVTMEFVFYGPAGDSVRAVTVGEANDTADKATNKAMSAALKYALMQTFMVPTRDLEDADRDHVESTSQRASEQNERERNTPPIADILKQLDDMAAAVGKTRAAFTDKWRRQHNVGPVAKLEDPTACPPWALHQFVQASIPYVEAFVAQQAAEQSQTEHDAQRGQTPDDTSEGDATATAADDLPSNEPECGYPIDGGGTCFKPASHVPEGVDPATVEHKGW